MALEFFESAWPSTTDHRIDFRATHPKNFREMATKHLVLHVDRLPHRVAPAHSEPVQVPGHREQRLHQDGGSRPGAANRQVQRFADLLSLVAVECGGVARPRMEGPCRRVDRVIRRRFRSAPRPS